MASPSPPKGFAESDMIFNKHEAFWLNVNADVVDNEVMKPPMSVGLTNEPSDLTMGALEKLPAELQIDVVLRLDIRSLFRFRDTCLAAGHFLHSMTEWKVVMEEHGLLGALRRSELGARVTLSELHSVVKNKECACCGKGGDHLAIKFWQRLCRACGEPGRGSTPVGAAYAYKLNTTK
ncbi:unnamed protein product [Penicillium bialowiezense]